MVNCSGKQTLKALLSLGVLLPLLMRWEMYIAGGSGGEWEAGVNWRQGKK